MTATPITTDSKTMLDFKPFQAWRYDLKRVSIQDVIAPPYDVISPQEQDALYGRSPFNCIRLILDRIKETDHETESRYTRARRFFQDWSRQGVLRQDNTPAFYLYRQGFEDPLKGGMRNRYALLGRLKLEPFSPDGVVPHEKTHRRPKVDRMKLLETTKMNLSPIFGLYNDPERTLLSMYDDLTKSSPIFDFKDEKGVQHALWVMTDSKTISKIHEAVKTKKIYIADGHHRYQTALDYVERQKKEARTKEDASYNHVLMALVEFHDPGLIVLPIHRLIRSLDPLDEGKALEVLKPYFDIQEVANDVLDKEIQTSPQDQIRFGLIFPQKSFVLTLRDLEAAKKKMTKGRSDIWYRLDVNLLSHFIFESLWKIPQDQWESKIKYTASFQDALKKVQQKECAASFIMKALKVEILEEVGKASELMPQKSTYFYPKLPSGLVFYSHESS